MHFNSIVPRTPRSLLGGLFMSSLPTKMLYSFIILPKRATCHAHVIRFDFDHPNNIWWTLKIMDPFIKQFIPPPFSSSLLDTNILFRTLKASTSQMDISYQ
jgi:hypothetical protein